MRGGFLSRDQLHNNAVLSSLLETPHSALAEKLRSIKSVTVGVVAMEYDSSHTLPQEYREVGRNHVMRLQGTYIPR